MFGFKNKHQEPAAPPVPLYEEDTQEVHTHSNPYCNDIGCWCHTNLVWHAQVTDFNAGKAVDPTLYQFAMATLGSDEDEEWCNNCYGVKPIGHSCYS
jgi:hypothetical protein